MSNRYFDPVPQYHNSAGTPYAGGFLYFYITNTTTATDTYSDSDLTTPNANPIELNSAGALPDDVFLDPAVTYKVVLKDSLGNTIWTRDPVVDPAANVAAAFRVFNANPNGNVAGNQGSVGGSAASVIFDISNNLLWVCTTTGDASTAVWTQVGATLSGAVSMTGVISPTSLGSDQNDYAPASFSSAAIIRQALSANVVITGLTAGTVGRLIRLQNISTQYSITLRDESSSSTAANRFALPGDLTIGPEQSLDLWYDTTSSRWRSVGISSGYIGDPGGRLTISTGEPVITSDVTAQATVYYTPYKSNYAKLYNGSNWYPVQFSELSQALSDATKSPLAATTNAVYDMFLWNDSGTLRCTRGPAWSSATARGTGAGTTELERVQGVYVNKVDITNGPTAQRGLYVGTIATNGSTQMAVMLYPTAAAGGSANRIDVWNMYNRIRIASTMRASDNTWTYNSATWRSANASTSNRITYVTGLNEEAISAVYQITINCTTTNDEARIGIGVDSATAFSGNSGAIIPGITGIFTLSANYQGLTGIGSHFLQALESATTNITEFWGDNSVATNYQMSLSAEFMY